MGLLTTIQAVKNATPDFVSENIEQILSSSGEDCEGLNPLHIERLHQIITGEGEKEVNNHYKIPLYAESEEGPWVLPLPSIFVHKLIAEPASLAPIAVQWAATPEMQADRWQAPAALLLLSRVRNFFKEAVAQGQSPILVISL